MQAVVLGQLLVYSVHQKAHSFAFLASHWHACTAAEEKTARGKDCQMQRLPEGKTARACTQEAAFAMQHRSQHSRHSRGPTRILCCIRSRRTSSMSRKILFLLSSTECCNSSSCMWEKLCSEEMCCHQQATATHSRQSFSATLTESLLSMKENDSIDPSESTALQSLVSTQPFLAQTDVACADHR